MDPFAFISTLVLWLANAEDGAPRWAPPHGFYTTEATAQPDCCSESRGGFKAPESFIEDLNRFLEENKTRGEGDDFTCESIDGIYATNDKPPRQMKFESVDMSQVANMGSAIYRYKSIHRVLQKNVEGRWVQSGLVVEDQGGRKRMVRASLEALRAYPTIVPNGGYLSAIEDWQKGNRKPSVEVTTVEFDTKTLNGTLDVTTRLRYLGAETVHDYTASFSKTVNNAQKFLGTDRVRVPPEMYELKDDPRFQAALDAKEYSKAVDLIYQKALAISKGDRFDALFISFWATALRARGPCGAVFGRRGHTLVPMSLFDGETTSYINPGRRDAIAHFFGSALMAQLAGGERVGAVTSRLGKEQQYYSPRTANFFRNLHSYTDEDAGVELVKGGYASIAGSTFARERLRIDIDRDIFYDSLGRYFGAALKRNRDALPSQTINDSVHDQRKRELGFGLPGDSAWEAVYPEDQFPKATAMPEELRHNDVPPFPDVAVEWVNPDRRVLYEKLELTDPYGSTEANSIEFHAKLLRLSRAERSEKCSRIMRQAEDARNSPALLRALVRPNSVAMHACRNLGVIEIWERERRRARQQKPRITNDDDLANLRKICEYAVDDFVRINACKAHNTEVEIRARDVRSRESRSFQDQTD